MNNKFLLLALASLLSLSLNAQIFQFRGENRAGKFPDEMGLLKQWPTGGPEILLEYEGIGEGYSSVISNGKYIYASGKIGDDDYLTCIDFNGNKKWQVSYGKGWDQAYPGNRGSVTIDGDRLYIISGYDQLSCLNAETGATIWSKDVHEEYQGEFHTWGSSESPLVLDNLVYITPGGSTTTMVAFDKMTGAEVWKSGSVGGGRGYTSPAVYNINGEDLIIATTAGFLLAVKPETGEIKASYKYFDDTQWRFQRNGMIWCANPVVKGNQIFISMGYNYGPGAKMLRLNSTNRSFEEVYSNHLLGNHHGGIVEVDGYMYGSNWLNNNDGNWVCLDWATGETMYDAKWTSKGAIVYADGLLYLYDEKSGEIGIMKPDPTGFNIISSFKVETGSGFHWAHPFFLNGMMFHRHGDVLTVYKVK
jgi:outer membrane protein assembly factor BamB